MPEACPKQSRRVQRAFLCAAQDMPCPLLKMVEKLSDTQLELVRKLAFGHHLKGHRDIEGRKVFRLYESDKTEPIASPEQADVETLRMLGLLASNMKFPAARFFLSPAGLQLAQSLPTE